jgi:Protein of unknown function (DUF2911)
MLILLTLSLAAAAGVPLPPGVRPADPACITMNTKNLPLATRKSPLDSVSFTAAGSQVKVCYGRPSLRGRHMIGSDAVPYGKIWRTGANEPTMIHTTGPLSIAGIKVGAGSYSLYTVPGASQWEVIVNRSITQWGEESNYTDAVKKQEVGRGKVNAEALPQSVETFTIKPDLSSGEAKALLLEWEKTKVSIPLAK